MAEGQQPIIVKKIKKGGHGHHGGAWKVAYADFVTAMMAFFLLLWLLNAVTQEQLEGISNYFAPVAASSSTSGAGEILGGKVISEEGSMPNVTSRPSVTMDLPPPKAGTGGEQASGGTAGSDGEDEQSAAAKEQQQFESAQEELEKALEQTPSLKRLAESLMMDNTPEGLRIQIVDQEGLAMFPRGSAQMYLHTRKLLELVAKVVMKMPQKLSISGHTDSTKYVSSSGYSNWELSADRANAARRALLSLGVPEKRLSRVVGSADTEPLLKDDPTNARNRRLSIVLMRGSGRKPKQEILPGLSEARERIRKEFENGGGASAPASQAPLPAIEVAPHQR